MTASAGYIDVGSTIFWGDSAQTPTYTMTLTALATVAARVGARADLGAWPRPATYRWYMEAEWTSAPTIDGLLELYFAGWDNDTGPANPQAQIPATDTGYAAAAAGLSKRKNMLFAGGVTIETSAVGPFSSSGLIVLPWRYVSPLIYNGGSVALATSTSKNFLRITPVYPEQQ